MSAAIAGLALLAALWSVAPPAAASSHCASQDSAARIRDCRTLIDLKDDLDPNNRLTTWTESNPMVNWEGIFSTAGAWASGRWRSMDRCGATKIH